MADFCFGPTQTSCYPIDLFRIQLYFSQNEAVQTIIFNRWDIEASLYK